jgi:hypothetical protein
MGIRSPEQSKKAVAASPEDIVHYSPMADFGRVIIFFGRWRESEQAATWQRGRKLWWIVVDCGCKWICCVLERTRKPASLHSKGCVEGGGSSGPHQTPLLSSSLVHLAIETLIETLIATNRPASHTPIFKAFRETPTRRGEGV